MFCVLWCVICTQPVGAATQSQDIDLSAALRMMERARTHSGYNLEQMEKCLLPYISTVSDNWKSIPNVLRDELSGMFQRPDSPQSWWYKAGLPLTFKTPHFVFHYTKTGPDAVLSEDVSPLNGIPDLVEICAEAFEKSYQVEVIQLGLKPPYDDFWFRDRGGDERYDVYMFSGPWLGFTMPEYPVAVQSTAAMMPIFFGMNSRMYEFFGSSEGRRYAQTTAAHEFLHSVQFAYNYYMPRWFMEASSTWVERMVYDGSDQDETNANNYYNSQLVYWFRYPDWSLTLFNGWHEYGDVIWPIFLTERYDTGIIKDLYEDMSEGTFRELANFYDVLASRGTTLGVAFKEFTLWNYFTKTRHDDRFYSHGFDYPPVSIHLDNIHREYPARVELDREQAPKNLGAKYIRFLPAPGQTSLSIKVDGSDVATPDGLDSLDIWATRGWGAKLVIHRKGRKPMPDEIFLFQRSQEGQRNFDNFGTEVEEVVLILSNLHPDLETGGIFYTAGQQPAGRLSDPQLNRSDTGGVEISWELVELSGIKEIAIVRKRFAPTEGDLDDSDIRPGEVYSASDLNGNGIADSNMNIVGKVEATDTSFVDDTTFMDIDVDVFGFDRGQVRYYYAVVPMNEYGIMGTPAITSNGITPTAPPPTLAISTQLLAPGEWQVTLHASQPLREAPSLINITPDGRRITVKLSKSGENDWLWQGELFVDLFPPTGAYTFVASAKGRAGNLGTVITEGEQFQYANDAEKQEVVCGPNPFRPAVDGSLKFYPRGFQISVYSIDGELVRELSGNEWDGRNEDHQPVASGVYIYLAESDGIERTGKIVVMW
ncbi:MXAN_6640 family putative metalloprotease [Candidatus Poribacteria bacterium]